MYPEMYPYYETLEWWVRIPGLRRSSAPFVRDCGVKRGDGLVPYYKDGSPSSRLRECPFAVCHCARELTRGQVALPNTLQECGVLPQFPAVELVGVEDAHWKIQLLSDDSHWLSQIRIVRYEHRNFELPGLSVAQEVGRESHVRTRSPRSVES